MKHILRRLSGVLVMLVLPVSVAWGQAAGTGIGGTAHDFSGIGATPTGTCTFCHTPHQAQTQALLWNHTLSANNFTWTDAATTAGTTYPAFAGDTYQGPTTRCLSCHDGSVAVGDIGWWLAGDPGSLLNVFIGENSPFNVGFGGNMDGNHPVAMPIPFNNLPSTYNGSTTGGGITLAEWQPDPQVNGIRLYTDDGAGGITAGATPGQAGIECTSCHDPHNGADVEDIFFLRGAIGGNAANYICIECHDK